MKTQPTQGGKAKFSRNRSAKEDIPLSSGKIKKRIRDVKRTIQNSGKLSAQVINEAKRRLRVLEFDLGEKTVDERERANLTKYHKVKHFERKKVERKIKQAKESVNTAKDPETKAARQDKLDEWEIKLLYVLHYPKTLRYVSLFPKENADDAKSLATKEKLLKEIKEALLAGDKDLTMLQKRYREDYKQKLIEKGLIQPVAPVDDEEIDTSKKEEKNEGDKDADDFFEQ